MIPFLVHPSLSATSQREDLLQSFRQRQVNHKFHYQSWAQTLAWLEIHRQFSPAYRDPAVQDLYEQAAHETMAGAGQGRWMVVGLGCGGGQKEIPCLKSIHEQGGDPVYAPLDASLGLVITALEQAQAAIPDLKVLPIAGDLEKIEELGLPRNPRESRLFTFYGLLPNFEPQGIVPRLRQWLEPGDQVLVSANLAPGPDYRAGTESVRPLYDNVPTRQWLTLFLQDHGIPAAAGELKFAVEKGQENFWRIVARFHFREAVSVLIQEASFHFREGDEMRVFYSYRHTEETIRALFQMNGFSCPQAWISPSQEEGVFLMKKS